MNRLLVALSDTAAATPVVAMARPLAALSGTRIHALHVGKHAPMAEAAARMAGIELHQIGGSTIPTLSAEAAESDVQGVLLGSRDTPSGGRPAGSTALALIAAIRKPVILVPPILSSRAPRIRRALFPLDGRTEHTRAVEEPLRIARAAQIEVVVLRVFQEFELPSFSDHLQHETTAWTEEFMNRHRLGVPDGVRMETRVGIPQEQVLDVADDLQVDLIALGWSQDLSPKHAAVVRATLARSQVPVLLLPLPLPLPLPDKIADEPIAGEPTPS